MEQEDKIYFPEDVREDVAIFANVTLFRAVVFIVIPIMLGVLFFLFLPLSIGIRLASLFFFPAAGIITVLMDIPGRLRRYRRYLKEPGRRKSGPPGEKESLQEMVGAVFISGPYMHFKDSSIAVFLKVDPPPWEHLTNSEKVYAEETFATAVKRASSYGLEVIVYADVDRDLCREEWDRREVQYNSMEDSGLKELGFARLRHHRNLFFARKTEYHVRIRTIPGMVDLQRRPANNNERRRLMEDVLRDAVGGIITELSRADISVSALGAESIRNLAVKQINPAAWRRVLPPLETDWTVPALYTDTEEVEENNTEKNKYFKKIREKLFTEAAVNNSQEEENSNTTPITLINNEDNKPQELANKVNGFTKKLIKKAKQRFSRENIDCTFSAGALNSKTDRTPCENKFPITDTVLTITSPWIKGCGVTTLTLETVHYLLEKGYTVGLIDANIRSPAVFRQLNIPDERMWEYDWRTGGIEAGIRNNRLLVWALDPLRPGRADIKDFRYIINAASALVDYLIVDGGSDPDLGLVAGHTLLLLAPCPNLPEVARAWNHFCLGTNSSLVLAGECDVAGFGLPVAGSIRNSGDWPELLNKILKF